jgi:rod shape-determining protein MreC
MSNLFAFLFRFSGLLVFGLLEAVALYLYITSNSYHRAAFFNSANAYTGQVLERRMQVLDYFSLADQNRRLLAENALLRQQVFRPDTAGREADSVALPPLPGDTLRRVRYRRTAARPRPDTAGREADSVALPPLPVDTLRRVRYRRRTAARPRPDTLLLARRPVPNHDPAYPLVPARVISQTQRSVDNYLTLNVGLADGVTPGLGIIAAGGVVGRVKSVSAHYATATSLLHSKTTVSAKLRRDGTVGSLHWPGDDPLHALLDYIPRQNRLARGDTVVTSGYNAIFPDNLFIGVVDDFRKEADKNFWTVRVRLGVDFNRLSHVYVVHMPTKAERDTVEAHAGLKPVAEDVTPAP